MAEKLNLKALEGKQPSFKPSSSYCRESDCLEIFIGGDDAYAERVDDVLTVFWSEEDDDSLMGCEIKGVRGLIKEAEAVGIQIAMDGKTKLSAVIVAYQGLHPDRIPVRTYNKLMKYAREQQKPLELEAAH